MEPRRTSGIRSQPGLTPLEASYEKVANVKHLCQFNNLLAAAMKEPYCIDDMNKVAFEKIWENILRQGEVYILYEQGAAVGFMALTSIIVSRSAYWEAFILPQYRRTGLPHEAARQVLEYAYKPYPDGLGLVKVKALISTNNGVALAAAEKQGGVPIAIIPFDGLFNQVPSDMLLLEFYNPKIFPQAEVLNGSGRNTERNPTSAELHQPGAVQQPAIHASGSIPESGGVHESRSGDIRTDERQLPVSDGRAGHERGERGFGATAGELAAFGIEYGDS